MMLEPETPSPALSSSPEPAQPKGMPLRIIQLRPQGHGRMLYLKTGDIIVGINGQPAAEFPDFENVLKKTLRDGSAILHVRRGEVEFRVNAERPLSAEFDRPAAEADNDLPDGLPQVTLSAAANLQDYEILRSRRGSAHSIPLKPSVAATVVPPFWLMSLRIWDAAVVTVAALATAFAVHWLLAVLCYCCISVFFSRNQLTLTRHLLARQGYKPILLLAEPNEMEAQRRALMLDPSLQFVYSAHGATNGPHDQG